LECPSRIFTFFRNKTGAINPNLFQDPDYKLGSLCNPDKKVRRKAINHVLECIDIAKTLKSKDISLWLGDGINFVQSKGRDGGTFKSS